MTIQLDGVVVSTTMRTPGHDFELAAGFCFTEGLLAGAPVTGVRYCANGAAAATRVQRGHRRDRRPRARRRRPGSARSRRAVAGVAATRSRRSSSGSPRCRRSTPIPPDVLAGVPDRVLGGQGLFASTGAVHAAAAFDRDGVVL